MVVLLLGWAPLKINVYTEKSPQGEQEINNQKTHNFKE